MARPGRREGPIPNSTLSAPAADLGQLPREKDSHLFCQQVHNLYVKSQWGTKSQVASLEASQGLGGPLSWVAHPPGSSSELLL